MSAPYDAIEKDLARHEAEIKMILQKIDDLSLSHAEIGFCLKTYMQQFPLFEKKIDDLSDKLQLLMPNRQSWDMERRMEESEKNIKNLIRYSALSAFALIILLLFNPESADFILGLFSSNVP